MMNLYSMSLTGIEMGTLSALSPTVITTILIALGMQLKDIGREKEIKVAHSG